MLNSLYVATYTFLVQLVGYDLGANMPPPVLDTWLNLFSLVGVGFALSLPFIIIVRVVRWLRG